MNRKKDKICGVSKPTVLDPAIKYSMKTSKPFTQVSTQFGKERNKIKSINIPN